MKISQGLNLMSIVIRHSYSYYVYFCCKLAILNHQNLSGLMIRASNRIWITIVYVGNGHNVNSVWIVFSVTIISGFVIVFSLYTGIINPICLCSMLSLIPIVVRTSISGINGIQPIILSQDFFFVGLFLTLLAFPSPTVIYNNVNQVFHTHYLRIHTKNGHTRLSHAHTHLSHAHTHTHTHSCTNAQNSYAHTKHKTHSYTHTQRKKWWPNYLQRCVHVHIHRCLN